MTDNDAPRRTPTHGSTAPTHVSTAIRAADAVSVIAGDGLAERWVVAARGRLR
jgi:hypothetical protein